jgi:hypothetical protein
MKSRFFLVTAAAIILVTPRYLYAQDGKTSPGYIVAEQEVINRDALQKFGACVVLHWRHTRPRCSSVEGNQISCKAILQSAL